MENSSSGRFIPPGIPAGLTGNFKGFTLVELLVVCAILGVVFVGIINVFDFAMKTWWHGSTSMILQQDAESYIYWIMHDFKAARASSIGSAVENTSFEVWAGDTRPFAWTDFPSTNITRNDQGQNMHSGKWSLRITGNNTIFNSNTFSIAAGTDYVLSGWIKHAVGQGKIETLGGFNISSETVSGFTDRWEKIYATGNSGANTSATIRLTSIGGGADCYFDDVSLYISSITFSVGESSITYSLPITDNGVQTWASLSFRFVPGQSSPAFVSSKIFRERLESNSWVSYGQNPVCENIKVISFGHEMDSSKEDYISIECVVEKEVTGFSGKREYYIKTRIKPEVP